MIALEEGYHVFNLIMQETGIDPFDRTEQVKANAKWALAKEHLRKASDAELDQNAEARDTSAHQGGRRQRGVTKVPSVAEGDTNIIEAVPPKAVPQRRPSPRPRKGVQPPKDKG